MDDQEPLVLSPTDGESLQEYLQRFSDEELHRIHNTSILLTEFCRILQQCFRDFEKTEDCLENLWTIIARLNNLDNLLYFVERLEPVRLELLEALEKNGKEIQRISTYCSAGRLVGSAVDIAGTVGGLILRDANPGYATLAFRAATSFGLLGFGSTLMEMNILRSSLDDLMKLIKKDEELFAPIHRWYHQSNELETAMQAIFPFDVTNQMVAEFADISNSEIISHERLLATLIRSIAEQDIKLIRDESLIRNLINFTLYPASRDWCEWIIFRRHPVILDITRMVLQLPNGPLQFILCQSIPALAIADQNIQYFPVWGRITLNCLSIYDSIRSLRRSKITNIEAEMRHLRGHFQSELKALKRIAEFISLRRKKT